MHQRFISSGLAVLVFMSGGLWASHPITAQDAPPEDGAARTHLYYLPIQARFAPLRGNSPAPAPSPTPGTPGPTPQPAASPFGVAIFDSVQPSSGLPEMSTAGAGWVMTNLRWIDVEPVEGQPYDFTITDAKIRSITEAGMRPFVLFDHVPNWAAVYPGSIRGVIRLDKADALNRVVRALAERYNGRTGHGQVDYWMLFGEPDHLYAWGDRPEDYADMLARVAPHIQAAHPQAYIMIGALAYDSFTTDPNPGVFRRDFLGRVLARLNTKPGAAGAYLDAVAFNYFDISGWRWPTIVEKTAEIRGIMAAHQVASLPVIITEMSRSSRLGGRDETTGQARWLVQSYVRGLSIGIEQMHWFQVFDMEPSPYDRDYGLFVRTNLSQPKPAFVAYATLTTELDQAIFERRLDLPRIEGYVFRQNAQSKTVAWGTGTAPVDMAVALACTRIVGRQGEVAIVADGGQGDRDGAVNGQILISLQPQEPVYIGVCQ